MKKKPAIPRLDGGPQTIILVEDVERSVVFYRDCMRFQVKDGDADRYTEFDLGDGGVLLLLKREGSIAPMVDPRVGGDAGSLSFSIAADAYDTWKKWFAKCEIEIDHETKWIHGGRSLFVRDPDGRRLEFKTPPVVNPPKPKPEPPKEKE